MIERPCFLVGAERSGTTLLRLMLSHHPRVAWSSEFEYAVDLLGATGWPDVRAYAEYLEQNRIFRGHGHRIDPALAYPELIDSFLEQTRRKQGDKPIVGATVHRHFDRLLRLWPDARFIHLVRDPRDTGRSVIAKGWAGNMWTGVGRWIEAEQLWAALRPTLPEERRVEVVYERLILDPPGELARLAAFLGVPYDAAMLDYTRSVPHFERPDPRRIGQWRSKLSESEVRLAEARLGPLLAERGYEPSGLPPLEVTPGLRRRLLRHDRWARLAHRVRTFGPRLVLEDWLTRRIGPAGWRRRVQRRLLEAGRPAPKAAAARPAGAPGR
jgi:hypothetical protein